MIGSSAVTSPPGDPRHSIVPSSRVTRSTGRPRVLVRIGPRDLLPTDG
jgi:hypothetical protein